MGLPWKGMTAGSLLTAYFLASREAKSPLLSFLGIFFAAWFFQFFLWAVWEVIFYPKYFSPLIGLPEPDDNSFLMGQYPRIAAEPTGEPMKDWTRTIPHNGVIRYLGFFNQERLLVTGPKALAEVLVTRNYEFQKPSNVRTSIGRILGVGVLLAEGDEHKIQRRNLMPAFAFRHIKDLYPIFWSKGRESALAMTRQIEQDAARTPETKGKAAMEVGAWASRTTLDIIGLAGMGKDFNSIADPNTPLCKTYQALFKPNRQAQLLGLLGLFLPRIIVNNIPMSRNNDIAAASEVIKGVARDLIREKKKKLERKELTDVDILSVALESGGFTEDNLVDQLMTFLAAGHETTAAAMTWAIYMLCIHQDVQKRLRDEIRANLPSITDETSTVGALDIDKLPYLHAVCNEVLRYYPPVPMTLRQAAVDTQIQDIRVPKGTRIMLCPWSTNKDTAQWGPDADRFNPDRWMPTGDPERDRLAASGGASSNYAFMTFIHGPRSCIGMAFAKAEFACLLATWIGRLEFELQNREELDEKNMEIRGGVTVRPAKGLHVWARPVDGW